MSKASVEGEDYRTSSISVLFEPINIIKTVWKRMEACPMQCMKVWLAREVAKLVTGQKMVGGSPDSRLSSSSASEGLAKGERQGQERRVRRVGTSWCEKVECGGNTKNGCRKPDTDISSVRRAKSSSDADITGESSASVNYSRKKVPNVVIEMESFKT